MSADFNKFWERYANEFDWDEGRIKAVAFACWNEGLTTFNQRAFGLCEICNKPNGPDAGYFCEGHAEPGGTSAEPSEGYKESEALPNCRYHTFLDCEYCQRAAIEAAPKRNTISRSQLEAAAKALHIQDYYRQDEYPWETLSVAARTVFLDTAKGMFHAIGMNVDGEA